MGRSGAAATHSAAGEGPSQSRTRRRRATQNVDNNETVTPELPGITDGKKALYHCNYCNKDISGKIRIKCFICSDFDLCVECFSVGAEVYPHKNCHPYRVMDNLAFPLITEDWNADEEMLLLEGLEMYGLCNWNEVAIHVATKSKLECIDHFNKIYMNSTCFPLPDMSRAMGKNKEELLAMAREPGEIKEDIGPAEGSGSVKMSTLGADDLDASKEEGLNSQNSFSQQSIVALTFTDKSIGDKEISMKELSGYNSKRNEFEIEYDNDAEKLLADMEFNETDTAIERELKLRVMRIYSKRLDERKRRKDFIVERNILHPNPFEKDLTLEEKELCDRYNVYMQYHSKEEHSELLRTVVQEHRILRRLQTLKEARASGCRTRADCEIYIEKKMKGEIWENPYQMILGTSQAGPSGRYLQIDGSDHSDNWDVTGFAGSELLSEAEQRLCMEMRILPTHYLNMQEILVTGIFNGNITKRSDAYGLFNIDPAKVDKIYDMLIRKGLARE